jgi:hypothetical protein
MQVDSNRPPGPGLPVSSPTARDAAPAEADKAASGAWPCPGADPGALAQLRRLLPLMLAVCSGMLAVIALVTWLTLMKDSVAITATFSDPADATGSRLVGLASTIGVLLWTAALVACVLGVAALRTVAAGTERARSFLAASALVVLMLLLDDFLAVHELGLEALVRLGDVARTTAMRNLSEMVVFVVYAIVVALYLWRFRSFVRRTEHVLLSVGGVLLALSLALDMAPVDSLVATVVAREHVHSVAIWLEEVPKLLGIAVIALYFTRLVVREVTALPRSGRQAEESATQG